jgi:hypothetical protein
VRHGEDGERPRYWATPKRKEKANVRWSRIYREWDDVACEVSVLGLF